MSSLSQALARAPRGEHDGQSGAGQFGAISTNIPARLDRLRWCRFHVLIVVALGVTWILDGLEVTIVGAIGPVLQNAQTLALSAREVGSAASAYVTGAVLGAMVFGWLTDRYGRRVVFYLTLIVYFGGVLLTATSWDFLSFAAFRAITGLGIGGEYAAINSAIDELIPSKYRGRVDLIVNGSFWLEAAAGSGASLLFLDPNLLPLNLGCRRRSRERHPAAAPLCAREPALAHHPWMARPGGRHDRRHRAARHRRHRRAPGRAP